MAKTDRVAAAAAVKVADRRPAGSRRRTASKAASPAQPRQFVQRRRSKMTSSTRMPGSCRRAMCPTQRTTATAKEADHNHHRSPSHHGRGRWQQRRREPEAGPRQTKRRIVEPSIVSNEPLADAGPCARVEIPSRTRVDRAQKAPRNWPGRGGRPTSIEAAFVDAAAAGRPRRANAEPGEEGGRQPGRFASAPVPSPAEIDPEAEAKPVAKPRGRTSKAKAAKTDAPAAETATDEIRRHQGRGIIRHCAVNGCRFARCPGRRWRHRHGGWWQCAFG